MKNSDDTIGNRTRDLRACSAVPQPNVPPRIPHLLLVLRLKMSGAIPLLPLHTFMAGLNFIFTLD